MDELQEGEQYKMISTQDNFLKKDIINQLDTQDEANKDDVPELKEKLNISMNRSLIEKLSNGILSLYVDDLKKASSSLNELTRNQNIVIETLEQESTRVSEALSLHRLEDMFSRIKDYHAKAQILKKDMMLIHERTSKLKKRALKLQQQKQKEALQKELMRDREIERDKQLAPKIAIKSSDK